MTTAAARNLRLVPQSSPAVVSIDEQIDRIARRIVTDAAELDGTGRLGVLTALKAARDAIDQAAREVEALIHDWIQQHGTTPARHGSPVCEIDGQWFKATWKGGANPKLPAARAKALYQSVAERIADDYDLDAAGQRILTELLDQSGIDDDDQVRLVARAVGAAVVLASADARQHALARVAEVYPVTTASAGPRSSVLSAGLDDRPVKDGACAWRLDLSHYQERGTRGSAPSFTAYTPTEDQP